MVLLYMVTSTINIPPMLAYIPAPWILWVLAYSRRYPGFSPQVHPASWEPRWHPLWLLLPSGCGCDQRSWRHETEIFKVSNKCMPTYSVAHQVRLDLKNVQLEKIVLLLNSIWGKTPLFIYFTVALVHVLFCRTCRVAELLVRDDRPLLMSSAVCDLLENWRGRPGAPKDTQGSTAGNRHTVIFGVLKWHWLCAKLWYIPELPF